MYALRLTGVNGEKLTAIFGDADPWSINLQRTDTGTKFTQQIEGQSFDCHVQECPGEIIVRLKKLRLEEWRLNPD